jgi:large subunit ribosomal protein L10
MPKTRKQKEEILRTISEKVKKSKSLFFAKFDRLSNKDSENLRIELEKENSEFMVAPKTITNLSLKNNNMDVLDARKFEGQVGIIFGYADEVVPAKIAEKFKKDHDNKIEFVGGILEGKALTGLQVTQLAGLPSKQELYAQIVGSMNAPISGFVNALAGNLRNLVYVLKAIEDVK